MNNNPISFNDPLGDTTRGTSNRSARRELRIIRKTFNGVEGRAMRKLFHLNRNTFASINGSEFLRAASKLSPDQRSLAEGYKKSINSADVNMVEVAKRGERLSNFATSTLSLAKGERANVTIDNPTNPLSFGGGVNTATATGTLTVFVKNAITPIPDFIDISTGSYSTRISSAGELSAHELLGHGLGWENRSPTSGHEDAIQMTNMYMRATGNGNFYRDGSSHDTRVALSYSTASGTPSYLNDTNNFFNALNSLPLINF
jgi:hypothetical protein